MDPVSISLGAGFPVYQMLKDLLAKLKAEKVSSEFLQEFQGIREAVLSLHEANLNLREQVEALTEQIRLKESLYWNDQLGAYEIEEDEVVVQVICPKCMAEKSKPVPMQEWDRGWLCPACTFYSRPYKSKS